MRAWAVVITLAVAVAVGGCSTEDGGDSAGSPGTVTTSGRAAGAGPPRYVLTRTGVYVAGKDIPSGFSWVGMQRSGHCRYQAIRGGKRFPINELDGGGGVSREPVAEVVAAFPLADGDSVEIINAVVEEPCVFWAEADDPAVPVTPWDRSRATVAEPWIDRQGGYLTKVGARVTAPDEEGLTDMGIWVCKTDAKYSVEEKLDEVRTAIRQYGGFTKAQADAVVDTARSTLCPRW